MLKKYKTMLRSEFSGYSAKKFGKDLMAGITVSAVALPLALAFGVSSGASAAAGLITAIIAGLVIGALSGSSFQISGPTGAMSAILVSIAVKYGLQGVFLSCVIAGLVLIVCGVFKLGRVVSIIPMPVITGFTSGIAIIIALGQVDNFFGVSSSGEGVVQKLLSYGRLGFPVTIPALALGAVTVLIMLLWPKKWSKAIPGSLGALIIVVAANAILKLDVAVVGAIPKTLLPADRLTLAGIDLSMLKNLATPTISIAVLGMIETLLCGASAARMSGRPFDGDMELVSQGIGNVIIPFFGGVPATAAIARTSVAIKAGGQTRLTGVVHSAILVLSMFLLNGVMSGIPMASLAGILIVTAWRMNEWHSIRYIFKSKFKGACVGYLLTMAVTVLFDLSVAIIAGVVFSAIMFVVESTRLEVSVSGVDNERSGLDGSVATDHIKVMYITGSVFFGTVSAFSDSARELKPDETLIVSMRGTPRIDSTGVQTMLELCKKQEAGGGAVLFCGVQKPVKERMQRGGLTETAGEDKFFWSAAEAIKSAALAPQ
jgi:SulP family sulfate permease